MNTTEAGLIRHVAQHHIHMEDPDFRARFLDVLGLDEEYDCEAIAAIEQFLSDICCHMLERLVV